jgi:hypothetical protein
MSHQAFIFTTHLWVGGFSPDMVDRMHLSGLKPPTYKIHKPQLVAHATKLP